MAHSNLSHRRTHNLLLISKLLNQRDHASPLTLVLDTLEQPANPLVREYLRRSRLSKTITVFLSFETFVKPRDVDYFVACHGGGEGGGNPQDITKQVTEILSRNPGKRTYSFYFFPFCARMYKTLPGNEKRILTPREYFILIRTLDHN